MTAAGFDSQIGIALESPSGTFTAPTRALEHVRSSLVPHHERIPALGIRATRRHQGRWYKGVTWIDGSTAFELSPINIGLLFTQALGAVNTSGANPYTHVFTPGPLVQTQTLTVQVGTPSANGTINSLSYTGMQITDMTITSKIGEAVMLDVGWYGQALDVGQSLTAASYSSTWSPFTFLHGVLSLAGSEYEFDDITINIKNGLRTGRHVHRTTTPAVPKISLESGFREFSGTLNSDFWDMTVLNRAIAGTEVALSLVFTNGANTLTIAGNIRTDVEGLTIDGPESLKQGIPFVFLSTTSDAAAFTATLVNTNSAP